MGNGGGIMQFNSMDYSLLFIFKTCAEVDSFSKASKILNVKQPAISYNINKLEELLNTRLFERGNFGIKLTNEGAILYDYVNTASNSILSGISIINELNQKEISEIKIGVSLNLPLISFSKAIKKFQDKFSNVKIIIKSDFEDIMLKELQEKKLDIVIFNSAKNFNINGIDIKKIKNNNIICVGLKKYGDILSNTNNLKKTIPIIIPDESTNLGKNLEINNNNVKFFIKAVCNSAVLSKELIKAGIGIGYINEEIVKEEIENKELVVISSKTTADIYSLNIALQNKNNNIVIKEFIKNLKEMVVDINEKNKM